ncbi:MAG: hypothetical protein ACE37E_01220 [Hyphomicrobiales bacterium]
MTVFVVPRGAPKSTLTDLTSTNATVVVEHAGRADKAFHGLHVANDSGTASTLTVTATIGGATFALWTAESVALNDTVPLELPGIIELGENGDVITVTAGHANRLHVTAFFTEFERNRGGG